MLRWLPAVTLAILAAGCASLPANTSRTASSAFDTPDQTALGRLVLERKAQAGARADSGFKLLDSVGAAFGSRLALIDGAQRSLDLQYYAIHADSSTEILLQRLRDAARRGVRVRILLDDFNTVGEDAQVLRLAFEPNVEIRLFNPLPGSRSSLIGRVFTSLHDMPRIQKRMHNKLFIADNADRHHRRAQPRRRLFRRRRQEQFPRPRSARGRRCRARHVRQFRPLLERRARLPHAGAGFRAGPGKPAQDAAEGAGRPVQSGPRRNAACLRRHAARRRRKFRHPAG